MSMKKAGITIFSLLIMFIIILLTIRGCSISKKSEKNAPQKNQSEVVLQEKNELSNKETLNKDSDKKEVENSENIVTSTPKKDVEEDKTSNVEKPIEKEEEIKPVVEDKKNETPSNNSSDLFLEVGEPELGEKVVTDALISSKKSYLVEDMYYAYSLGILIPNGEKYEIVNYYCPKKTYDAVSSGQSIKVEYQVDRDGKISIDSISK